jgi:hypothetical protein
VSPMDLVRKINPTTVRGLVRGLRGELPGSDQARYLAEATAQSDGVYDDLVADPDFYLRFETE